MQSQIYCKKDGDWEEYGVLAFARSGRRTDLEDAKGLLDAGMAADDLARSHFSTWVIHRRAFREYVNVQRGSGGTRIGLRVVVLHGVPGTGKSRSAYEVDAELFSCPDPTLHWFDGYRGEEVVLFDDYRGGGDAAFLLKLLDIYPLQVPVKGGFTWWKPKLIIITSNIEPPFGHYEVLEGLERRIHKVIEFQEVVNFDDAGVVEDLKVLITNE